MPEPEETSEYGWDEIPADPITDVELILKPRLRPAQVTETVLADAAADGKRAGSPSWPGMINPGCT